MAESLDSSRTECWSGPQSPEPTPGSERTVDGDVPTGAPRTLPEGGSGVRSLAGRTFGDYDLQEEVARGGMGVVYKALHRSLERVVALKMILDGELASEQAVQRFYQEARAAAALDHPHIVPIHEIGQCEGRHFFTMAFVEGTTLSALVRKNGVPAPAEAAGLVVAIADAVEFAHRRGVLHRDLKPDNVLIDLQGRPRVTDFGLAKSLKGDSGMTSAGQILGTPAYMAPEQAWGRSDQMGPGTDVYALGGILYFLLTGRAPFEGASTMEVLSQVTAKPPIPPRQLMPETPADLEAICLKCLEKEPSQRYASAQELAVALRGCCEPTLPAFSTGTLPELVATSFNLPDVPSSASVPPWPAPLASVPAPAPSGRLFFGALAAIMAVALVAAGGWYVARGGWWSAQGPGPTAPPVEKAVLFEPTHRDFDVKVEIAGAQANDEGEFRLVEGRPVSFRIEVGRDAYVGIWTIAPDGAITQLFPNEVEKDNRVKANQVRVVPDPQIAANQKGYRILAETSTGQERVWVAASTKPWDSAKGEQEGPYLLFKTAEQREELKQTLRGLRLKANAQQEEAQLSEEVLRYRVAPAGRP